MRSIDHLQKYRFESIRPYILLAAYLLIVGLFYIFTLQSGVNWGDDFAMYIALAKNIALGHTYVHTGYIPNPNNPNESPLAYPPIFPLILSPIYAIFGLNIYAMKITLVVIMLCMLVACYFHAKPRLNDLITTYLYLGAVGFSPWLWEARGHIASEIPFMFFLVLSLILADAAIARREAGSARWRLFLGCAAGVTAYLAYGTREVGGLLIPVFVFFDILQNRRISAPAVMITLTFVVLAAVQRHFVNVEKGYAEILNMYHWSVFYQHVISYGRLAVGYWGSDGLGRIGAFVIFMMMAPLYVVGWCKGFTSRKSIYSVFVPAYVFVLVVIPISAGERYFLPIMPLLLLDIFVGVKVVGQWLGKEKGRVVAIIVAGAVSVSYVAWYRTQDFGPVADGPYSRPSLQLFAFIRKHTSPNSVFIFRKPRALALYTGRRSSPPPLIGQYATLWRHIETIGATYVVVKYGGVQFDTVPALQDWAEENRRRLELVFRNQWFDVYRIKTLVGIRPVPTLKFRNPTSP